MIRKIIQTKLILWLMDGEEMEHFHISRTGILSLGEIRPMQRNGFNNKEWSLKQFPDNSPNRIIEDIFEKCRIQHFSSHVSRLKAFYTTDRFMVEKWLHPLKLIANGVVNSALMVYKIRVDTEPLLYDARWVDNIWGKDIVSHIDEIEQRAIQYWECKHTSDPLYEFLCTLPVVAICAQPIFMFINETMEIYQDYINKAPNL